MSKSKSQKPILKKKRLWYTKPAPICPTDEENRKRIDEFLTTIPKQITETRAHYQCPGCGVDMNIAGRYDRTSEYGANGKSLVTQFDCYGCGKRVIPKMKEGESNDVKS